jgi:hypothetical protein
VASSYGFQLGAINKWALEAEDHLTMAIGDFPKRGILVRDLISIHSFLPDPADVPSSECRPLVSLCIILAFDPLSPFPSFRFGLFR